MPKIFERDGYGFYFYSNEHRPIHVHARYGSGEAIFNVEEGVELRESQGLKVREPEPLATFQGCARPRAQHCPMNRRFQDLLPAPGLRTLLRPGTGALRHLRGESITVSQMIGAGNWPRQRNLHRSTDGLL